MAWVFKIHLAVTVCVFCEICHNLEFSLLHTVLFYPIYLKSQIFWNKSWKFQVGYSWHTGFLKSICIWLIKFTTILDFFSLQCFNARSLRHIVTFYWKSNLSKALKKIQPIWNCIPLSILQVKDHLR